MSNGKNAAMIDAPAVLQWPLVAEHGTTQIAMYVRHDIFEAYRAAVDAMLCEKMHITDAVRLAYAAQSFSRLHNIPDRKTWESVE